MPEFFDCEQSSPDDGRRLTVTDNDDWLDWDWGFMDGLLDMPIPEFLPPDSYFGGRREGDRARERKLSEAA